MDSDQTTIPPHHLPVDLYRAEGIAAALAKATGGPGLGVVQIRECLEGEPVSVALERIRWAMGCARPYRALRNWARDENLGFYKSARRTNPALVDRKTFLHYTVEKAAELGRELSRNEVERLASRFYSPKNIARLAEISEHVWRSYEETYEVAGSYHKFQPGAETDEASNSARQRSFESRDEAA